jgi:hypothetical protein
LTMWNSLPIVGMPPFASPAKHFLGPEGKVAD